MFGGLHGGRGRCFAHRRREEHLFAPPHRHQPPVSLSNSNRAGNKVQYGSVSTIWSRLNWRWQISFVKGMLHPCMTAVRDQPCLLRANTDENRHISRVGLRPCFLLSS
ncbi:hypothetical protein GJAV_G00121510, partial [Gymnothorax javanicus]